MAIDYFFTGIDYLKIRVIEKLRAMSCEFCRSKRLVAHSSRLIAKKAPGGALAFVVAEAILNRPHLHGYEIKNGKTILRKVKSMSP